MTHEYENGPTGCYICLQSSKLVCVCDFECKQTHLNTLIKIISGLNNKRTKILPSGSLKEKPPCGAKEKLVAAVEVLLLTESTAAK